jgi:rhodanese-related sulfurtransferase
MRRKVVMTNPIGQTGVHGARGGAGFNGWRLEREGGFCQFRPNLQGDPMPQTITTGIKALCEAAEREIETLPTEDAVKLAGRDDTVLVDIRDIRELQRDGKVPGAFHCPRGMLEFWIDPESPYHKPVFAQDKKYVFFCAGGLRSALAAQTAHRMGLKPVAHIKGGFGAWKKAGGPVEAPAEKKA